MILPKLFIGIILTNIVYKIKGQYNVTLKAPQAAVVGYSYQLTCTVEPNVLGVGWSYRSRGSNSEIYVGQIETNGCTAHNALSRYSYACGTQSSQRGEYKLTIMKVIESDDYGIWTCRTVNTNIPFSSNNFKLLTAVLVTLYEIPDTIKKFGSLQRITTEFQRISMKCSGYGFPAPTVSWMTKGTKLISDFHDVLYNLTTLWTNHRQKYFCIGSNIDYVKPENVTVELNVMFGPKLLSVMQNISAIEGQKNVQFTCPQTEANPSTGLTFQWTKSRIQVGTARTLLINNVNRSHAGEYSCRMSNSVGTSDPSYMFFNVFFRPRPLYILPNISATEHQRQIQLQCPKIEANPSTGLTYKWTKSGMLLGTAQKLIIKNVNRSHAGQYTCCITNSVGTSDPSSIYLNVLEFEAGTTQDSTVLNTDSIALFAVGTLLCIVGISFIMVTVIFRRNKNTGNRKGEDNEGRDRHFYDDLNLSQINKSGNTYEEIRGTGPPNEDSRRIEFVSRMN